MSTSDWLREQIESQSALELAVELHMYQRDRDAHPRWAATVAEVLLDRLEHWRPSLPGSERFDDIARALICEAVASYAAVET